MSNTEMNQITKEALRTGLILLLNEKNMDEITISELVNKSGVSRMAFYRNYEKKEDILIELGQEVSEALKKSLEKIKTIDDIYNYFLGFFTYLSTHKNIFIKLMNAKIPDDILDQIPIFQVDRENQSSTKYYSTIGFIGLFKEIVRRYVEGNMKESPQEMADLLYTIFKEGFLNSLSN